MFQGVKLLVILYAVVVVIALLAAVAFTNLYLTKALFAHIQQPLDMLVQGVQRIRDGDLEPPIAYTEPDEFHPACDAVDEMAALIAFSRLYLYVHFPSDVLAGAVIGVGIGVVVFRWGGKLLEKLSLSRPEQIAK